MISRIIITGDKHGNFYSMIQELKKISISKDDVVIILGDHGTLYYGKERDRYRKKILASLPCTFVLIRGNHDRRPTESEYKHTKMHVDNKIINGEFVIDNEFPNLLYTNEYGWYRFGTKKAFVIGGAYSVDKERRLKMNQLGFVDYKWFIDEQLTLDEMQEVNSLLKRKQHTAEPFVIMSHTCPAKYKPIEQFLTGIDQRTVDDTMEKWLDIVEETSNYDQWYCGHWHTDKHIDKIHFLYDDVVLLEKLDLAEGG